MASAIDSLLSPVPPGVSPDDYANWQRQQLLAKALLGEALSPIQAPETQPVRGLYVQPRVGAAQVMSKLAAALLGGRATDQALASQAGLNQQSLRTFAPGNEPTPGTPLQTAQPQSQTGDPNEQSVQPLVQRNAGQSLAQALASSQPQRTPVNPRNPWGLPADVVRNMAMNDPAGYAKALQGPDAVQLGRIAGLTPQQSAAAAFTKQTAIEQRPGSTVIDPVTGRTMVGADPSKGEYYVTGADGSVTALPITNDATIQAWRTGLTTAATQANTPREIPMGGGVTKLGYPPTPPALAGNPGVSQPVTAAGAPGAAPAVGPAPGGAPSTGAPPANQPAPSAAAAGPVPITQQGDAKLWQSAPKLQIPSSPGQTSNAYQQGNLQAASAKNAELVNTYGQESKLADLKLQYNAQALKDLPSASVGPMSEWLTTNRQRLMQLGVPASLIPESGSVTPTLELNKYLLNSALQGARQIYGSRMTQNEVQLQTQEMSPSAHMTAAAVQSLVQQDNVQQQYAKQRAADYTRYSTAGGDPMQFESWYSQNRPLSRFAAQQLTPNTPGQDGLTPLQRLQAHPEMLPAFKDTFGWDPTQ